MVFLIEVLKENVKIISIVFMRKRCGRNACFNSVCDIYCRFSPEKSAAIYFIVKSKLVVLIP